MPHDAGQPGGDLVVGAAAFVDLLLELAGADGEVLDDDPEPLLDGLVLELAPPLTPLAGVGSIGQSGELLEASAGRVNDFLRSRRLLVEQRHELHGAVAASKGGQGADGSQAVFGGFFAVVGELGHEVQSVRPVARQDHGELLQRFAGGVLEPQGRGGQHLFDRFR